MSRLSLKLLESALRVAGRTTDNSFTYHARPNKAANCGLWSDRPPSATVAVILQGPVSEFTLETVRIYQRTFPGCMLIVSTWETEAEELLRALGETATVLASRVPERPGQQHFNYQLLSSRAGVHHAAAAGARYVLKTRTDQRMYATNVTSYLVSVLQAFPIGVRSSAEGRIVGLSLNTYKYRLYGLSDMLYFGYTSDILRLFDAPMTDNRVSDFGRPLTLREAARDRVCEVYLTSEYLQRSGWNLEWTLTDSWRAFAELFCVIDASSVDLFWPKYEPLREYRRRHYDFRRADELLSFSDWITLLSGGWSHGQRYEHVLDLTIDTPLSSLDSQSPIARVTDIPEVL